MYSKILPVAFLLGGMMWVIPPLRLAAQTSIDSSFAFQSDPAKKYSLYIPSSYDESQANPLILTFHPLNAVIGNGKTWRDKLSAFAESNGLILVSPDGGPDGRIDDAIDKDFSTALLDSVLKWYNINEDKMFIIGFSWGGRATYTYGLANHQRFAGFMPIASFINGTTQVGSLVTNAVNEPFYLLHGDRDFTATLAAGFFPIRDALIANGAILNSRILAGVGHTIDFQNRDEILTTAYLWLDSVSTKITVNVQQPRDGLPRTSELNQNYPNPFNPSTLISYSLSENSAVQLTIFNTLGQLVRTLVEEEQAAGQHSISWDGRDQSGRLMSNGIYFYRLKFGQDKVLTKRMIMLK